MKLHLQIEYIILSIVHWSSHFVLATVIFSRAMRKKVPCVVEIRNSADDRSGTAAGLYQLRVFAHWSVLTYHGSERAPQGFCTERDIRDEDYAVYLLYNAQRSRFSSNWKRFVSSETCLDCRADVLMQQLRDLRRQSFVKVDKANETLIKLPL